MNNGLLLDEDRVTLKDLLRDGESNQVIMDKWEDDNWLDNFASSKDSYGRGRGKIPAWL